MRYYVAGEYNRIGDPSQAMAPGAVGTTLVQQHAIRVDESRMAVCAYIFSALDRLSSEDWENPPTRGTGFLG